MKYASKSLDHLGIVSGLCKEIGLVETIDDVIGVDEQQIVTTGESVMSMVINALGFVSKPLYMFPDFMEKKPVKLLFRDGLNAEDFNDDTLGRALDRLYENDPTKIFSTVSSKALSALGIKRDFFHLDTTTMNVHGEYTCLGEDMIPILITYGKSKAHREDLKQFIISLITVSEFDLPVWIKALSGNTSDKTHFREVIGEYSKMLTMGSDEKAHFIMDSAMYTDKNIRAMSDDIYWLSRVPESIKIAKELLISTDLEDMIKSNLEGYHIKSFSKTYADVNQKWVVVFSEKSFDKEIKTFEKKVTKEGKKIGKEIWHLGNHEFTCKEDALKSAQDMEKKWKYYNLDDYEYIEKKKNVKGKCGRPSKDTRDIKIVYKIKASYKPDEKALENERKCKGKFIVATNDLNLPEEDTLKEYKGQQSVERGFRFIKDPLFFASATFLKSPRRIVSLVMIMGLSLLIYSLAQRKLRKALESMDETIPNQVRKPTKKPTMRYVFQIFEGLEYLIIKDRKQESYQILNMKPIHKQILALMGPHYENIYLLKRGCGM
jgi:transposase